MVRLTRVRLVAAAGLVALGLAASGTGVATATVADPAAVDVRVGATGSDAEVNTQRTIPIIRSDGAPGSGRRVVVRLKQSQGDLPSLFNGDRLRTLAELQVTTDCRLSSQPCVGRPYTYAPKVKARLLLTRDPDARRADGTSAVRLGEAERTRCGHTEHHCKLVFRRFVGHIGDGAGLIHNPCASSAKCFVTIVANAWHANARADGPDRLLIGENEPDGSVKGNKASMGVVRVRPGSASGVDRQWKKTSPARNSYPVTDNMDGDRYIVYRQAIGSPKQGRSFAYDFVMETRPTANFPIRISTKVIVTSDPGGKQPVGDIYPNGGNVSRFNGENCLGGGPCYTRHVGVFRAQRDFGKRLYVLVLAKSSAPFNDAGNNRYNVRISSGDLTVTRYVAS